MIKMAYTPRNGTVAIYTYGKRFRVNVRLLGGTNYDIILDTLEAAEAEFRKELGE